MNFYIIKYLTFVKVFCSSFAGSDLVGRVHPESQKIVDGSGFFLYYRFRLNSVWMLEKEPHSFFLAM